MSCWTSACECRGLWDVGHRGGTPFYSPPSFSTCCRLRLGAGDVLTFYDGDDLTARILGQYTGARGRFKLFASSADVTIQFQSDPGAGVFAYRQGFVIHFSGEPHGCDGCRHSHGPLTPCRPRRGAPQRHVP